jgi:cyclic pyranopterin phosphate synthase
MGKEGKQQLLHDAFGRPVNNLRISLTQRCNFKCFFCHREGEQNASEELSAEEIGRLVEVASSLGMRSVKLTGGEPLLREDIVDIVSSIAPHVDEVSMTTNGTLLKEYAKDLHRAGLRRVNISLHSLDPETFKRVTESNALDDVKNGIWAAVDCGLEPVKLNMVVLEGLNDMEIPKMIEFSKTCGAILQLIEFQPIQAGTEPYWQSLYHDLRGIENTLEANSLKIQVRELQRRKQYYLKGGEVVEVVRPMHNTDFCRYCTRLRVTSDGKLKPCLMRNDNLVDVLQLLREGSKPEALETAFKEAVSRREPYWRS